ncbi:MAG: DUF1513 domain-containing protein [Methylobacteriaceae bacterium]|nr:DUF1513 domain-containing protein [Methylobacteriaceae bacterium]
MDRRSFLVALGAACLPGAAGASATGPDGAEPGEPVYVSAAKARDGSAAVAAFGADGRLIYATRLPERGHDVAPRPLSDELVVFARRPGNWAAIVDRRSGAVSRLVTSPPGRHFFGHGVFTADGTILYATENLVATGEGVLGLYDARDGYRRVGERPTHGIGPHDLAFLPGGALLVANGGTRTQPETGREILNPDSMEPSLAILDPATGAARLKAELGPDLRGLSIRHLAVMPDGSAAFGCQWEGDREALPPLVGLLAPDGRTRFLDLPEDDLATLDNYIGSVRLDRGGRVLAATSPKGGSAVFWDLATGRYLGRRALPDVCGVAEGAPAGAFVMTSGHGEVRAAAPDRTTLDRLGGSDLERWMWDNHLVRL